MAFKCGYDVDIKVAPYQVNYGDNCGGVIIHLLWVITVAHCGAQGFVRVGNTHRLKGKKILIEKYYQHPKYQKGHEFNYDVQLLLLQRRLKCRAKCVATIGREVSNNVYVYGWGSNKEGGEYIDTLQRVLLEVVPLPVCQEIDLEWYNHTLTSCMFCAGEAGRDACQGDSGGAAVSSDRLVGLSSFGYGCGRDIPGVYINVTSPLIRSWISSLVGE